jgi:hypothetical protein
MEKIQIPAGRWTRNTMSFAWLKANGGKTVNFEVVETSEVKTTESEKNSGVEYVILTLKIGKEEIKLPSAIMPKDLDVFPKVGKMKISHDGEVLAVA